MNKPDENKPENSERSIIPIGPKGIELRDLDGMFRFARCYIQSGLAPTSFKTEQQLVIAWCKAAELGLSPLQATDGMSIINNRVGIMGDLALAMVESSGQLAKKSVIHTGEGDALTCEVTLQRKGRQEQTYTFSVKEAKLANIYDRSAVWRSYPKRMTYYRALGFGLRDEFPDILKGTKTLEELQDYPDSLAADEAKIIANQKREEDAKLAGAKFVAPIKGSKRPTPREAVEPAFPEDKPSIPPDEPPDDIDMGPEPPKPPPPSPVVVVEAEEVLPPSPPPSAQKPSPPAGELFTPPPKKSAPEPKFEPEPPPEEPAWKSWVIKSIPANIAGGAYYLKKIDDLTDAQLKKVELQWLPAIKQDWNDANEAQKADAAMFEAAIAARSKTKPW